MDTEAPPGFLYRPDFVSEDQEHDLLAGIQGVAFSDVRMHGVTARRHTAHFGWLYGYETSRIEPGPAAPDFLRELRGRTGDLAGIEGDRLEEVLLTEYPAGAGIGWHRDAPMFGLVVGVSLLGLCRLRFQRGAGTARQTCAVTLAPRSAYVLTGAARSEWQHSIPPTKTTRYSITFRTLRRQADAASRARPAGRRQEAL
ncbi:MAG: alpha-ketoglutarate-dependent dioxygenase AlkB [Candidatus Rokuibacteriota bacterium]